jgi:exodeoxyribonuclease-3
VGFLGAVHRIGFLGRGHRPVHISRLGNLDHRGRLRRWQGWFCRCRAIGCRDTAGNAVGARRAVLFATWNVNSLAVRLPQLLQWLAEHPVDALVLQETKLTDDKFPRSEIEATGYQLSFHGQKTYNGVALLSRAPQRAVQKNIPGFADEQARLIAATLGEVRVIGAYFPNGQAPGSDKFAYKMSWLEALQGFIAAELAQHAELVLMGDFNIAPEDRDVFDPVAWAGQIHCTDEERAHFRGLQALGLSDAFRLFEQAPRAGAGGTTATWPSARTRVCASTTSWSARRCARGCWPAASTRRRARTSGPATTRR